MILVEEYIRLPREVRRQHLDLNEPCLERGGYSIEHRGVLAQYLNTNIPKSVKGNKICLCHACFNGKCSNPRHLYWGTAYENNVVDRLLEGTFTNPYLAKLNKYGKEKLLDTQKENGYKGGKARWTTSINGRARDS